MTNIEGKIIADELGTIYELDRKLGEGGQGTVYAVRGGRRAIKILSDRSGSRRELLRRQIKLVRQLDLQGLAIARPLELLSPPLLGYVMELLTDMIPLTDLIEFPKKTEDLVAWYLQGGGLRRRLHLLARFAEILSHLHIKGLAYGDPSPSNVFISAKNESLEVWLIDADNLRYEASASSNIFRTTPYAAPELELGRSGINTLTDTHAFAVIAFKTLCLVHPLMGDLVENGEPDFMTQAVQGLLPWVDDHVDNRNSSSYGFPRNIVLSPNLQKICENTFGDGLNNPNKRPSISKWVEALHSASDYTLTCPNCQSTFYANSKVCPWCDAPSPLFVQVVIRRWEPEHSIMASKPLQAIALQLNFPIILTRRITRGWVDHQEHKACLSLTASIESTHICITLQSMDNNNYWLTSKDNIEEVEIRDRPIRFLLNPDNRGRCNKILHFEPLDIPQRVAEFTLMSGGLG